MQLHRIVDETAGIVCATITGEIRLGPILEEMSRITNEPSFDPNLPVLVDLRQATSSMTADEILTLTQSIKHNPKTPREGRRALLVSTELMYGLFRMFEAFSADGPVAYRAFESEKEAREWLVRPS